MNTCIYCDSTTTDGCFCNLNCKSKYIKEVLPVLGLQLKGVLTKFKYPNELQSKRARRIMKMIENVLEFAE